MISGSTQIVGAWNADMGAEQRRIYLDYWECIEDAAKARWEMHRRLGNAAGIRGDARADMVGLAGEFEFAKEFGCPVDMTSRPGGDGGVDFEIGGLTIDVKTAEKPYYLLYLVEKLPVIADIYVLAGCDWDGKETWLVGWAWGDELTAGEIKEFRAGSPNKAIHHSRLRDIEELHQVLGV